MATTRKAALIIEGKHNGNGNGNGKRKVVWASLAALPSKTAHHSFGYPLDDPVITIEVEYYTTIDPNPALLNVFQEYNRTQKWPQHMIVGSILSLLKTWNLVANVEDLAEDEAPPIIPLTLEGIATVPLTVLSVIMSEVNRLLAVPTPSQSN